MRNFRLIYFAAAIAAVIFSAQYAFVTVIDFIPPLSLVSPSEYHRCIYGIAKSFLKEEVGLVVWRCIRLILVLNFEFEFEFKFACV